MEEESPCFALGLVEERKQPCGFLALRPAEVIPPEISGLGFNFGHALLGTTEFEVIQFVFHFYGFETYNMLVNPNNRLVKTVLMRMVESGDYFFFAISCNQSVTAFRSEIGPKNLAGLSTNLRQIQERRMPNTKERWRNFGDVLILPVKYSIGSAAITSAT
jgi:hypothetical protein